MDLWNDDCIEGSKKNLADNSIDLLICDPPFGINETTFHKHYNRDESTIIDGYVEAPSDHAKFTYEWIEQAKRVLKQNGTFYIISGWSNLKDILVAIDQHQLLLLNHCIWKFNFGVNTTKKFVTSHYHVLRCSKSEDVKFNTFCRFGPQEKDDNDSSSLYKDLEDVFVINKEFSPGETKNKNKLPSELIQKLVLYSSDENDMVCDFFMGNFTTAHVAHGLGRQVSGFEMNKNSYDINVPILEKMELGCNLANLKQVVVDKPENQGKPISDEERELIRRDYSVLTRSNTGKKAIEILTKKYGRGRFSIANIVEGTPETSGFDEFL